MNSPLRDKFSVLMIAYGFPPAGGSTAIRVLKFCKYLVRFNWKPVVLTVSKPRVFEFDSSLLAELPSEAELYRTPSLELPYLFYKNWPAASVKPVSHVASGIKRALSNAFKRARYLLFIIDERCGWVPFAVIKGLRIVKKRKIKLIYVAVKPFSSLITAFLLKRITGLPLVIDFHDAWVSFNQYFWSDKPVFLRKFEGFIEKIAVQNADKIISVNDKIINDFQSRYSYLPADKFSTICNGYDPEDFSAAVKPFASVNFTITYAGSLYAKRSPENFLKALKLLIEENPRLREKVRFCYIGKITIANQAFFNNLGLEDIIELPGMLPHGECIMRIRKSDLLLFIEDQVEISGMLLPTKIFEYVASGRPILALAKNGLASDIIRASKSGVIVENNKITEIKDSLIGFIEGSQRFVNVQNSNKPVILEYSQVIASKRLASVFNDLNRQFNHERN